MLGGVFGAPVRAGGPAAAAEVRRARDAVDELLRLAVMLLDPFDGVFGRAGAGDLAGEDRADARVVLAEDLAENAADFQRPPGVVAVTQVSLAGRRVVELQL